ncbi:MAG: HAD family hydrolase [Candidatus Norongarragalinales archaeon]
MTKARTKSLSKLEGLRAVLFDLEGVLDDHLPRQAAIVEEALKQAGLTVSYNVKDVYHLRSNSFMHEKKPFFQALLAIQKIGAAKATAATPTQLRRIVEAQTRKFTAAEKKAIEKAISIYSALRRTPEQFEKFEAPVEGSLELLKKLHATGMRIGVITNANNALAQRLLKKHGFAPFVHALVTDADSVPEKPAPDGVRLLLKKLGVGADEAVLVDDSIAGIEAGKRAGLKATVGVLSGNTNREAFEKGGRNKPDFVLKRASELFNVIEKR